MAETLTILIDLDTRDTKRGFNKISEEGRKTAGILGKDFGQRFSKAFNSNVRNLGAVFLAAVGIRKVADSFLSLERSIAEVNTIAGDLTKTNQELAQQFIRLSGQFGGSAASQAKAFYQIISAGISDTTRANDLLIASNKLAIGGLTDQASAIDILTGAVNAFRKANLTGSRAADILFTTVRLGKTTVAELASSLGRALTPADALGVTFEELSAGVAVLTTRSIKTAEAVTGLRAVFTAVISKQKEAANQGEEVAKAFSLQALRTKGLSKFLRDLFKSVDGSTERLNRLLGSAEATTAVLALASDNFESLDSNLKQLQESSGAADEAFRKISQTVGQQLRLTLSNLLGIITQIASRGGPLIIGALENLNDILKFINTNLEIVISTFLRFGRVLLATAIIINRKLILDTLIVNFVSLQRVVGASVLQFRTQLALAVLVTGNRFKGLILAIKNTQLAMQLLSATMRIFKAVASFGVLLAVDELIVQFVKLKSEGLGLAQIFDVLGKRLKLGFLLAMREVIEFIAVNFGAALRKVGIDAFKAFETVSREIGKTTGAIRTLREELNKQGSGGGGGGTDLDNFVDRLKEVQSQIAAIQAESTEGQLDALTVTTTNQMLVIEEALNQGLITQIEFQAQSELLSKNFEKRKQALLIESGNRQAIIARDTASAVDSFIKNSIVQGFAEFGRALAQGEDATAAFGNTILGIFGDFLIQLGTSIVFAGKAISALAKALTNFFTAPLAIVAGIALIAVGAAIKGSAGGPSSTGASATTPTGASDTVAVTEPIGGDDALGELSRNTAVTVNVEGTVLNPIDTGRQIADLLDEAFNAGASTVQVNTA